MAKRQNFVVGSTNTNTQSQTTTQLNEGWNRYDVLYSGKLDGVFNAVSDYSNDSSNEIANAIKSITGSEPTGSSQSELADALNQLREDIETSSLTFVGYVATTAPSSSTYALQVGNIWINASAMPTSFPVAIAGVWNGTSWESTTDTYTQKDFDFFRNINDNEGYYWFGGQWVVMSTDMSTTYFTLNQTSGKWEIKSSVNLPGNPTTTTPTASSPDTQIATKKYVDDATTNVYHPDLLSWQWDDHLREDVQWLRGDTFSWQDGTVYDAAYQHLLTDYNESVNQITVAKDVNNNPNVVFERDTTQDINNFYGWSAPRGATTQHLWTATDSPIVGDTVYGLPSSDPQSEWTTVTVSGFGRDTVAGYTITYHIAQDGHKICPANQESTLIDLFNATGVAWYYIIDTTNTRFKFPRTRFGVVGTTDQVGKYVIPELPNITGTFVTNGATATDAQKTGAFYSTGGGNNSATGSGLSGQKNGYGFDASLSSSIYKDAGKVQPPATQMYLYFYVGRFTQSAIENTAGLNADLFNGKADVTSLVTETAHVVTEFQAPSAANGYTWYRKYKDGWVEQGGTFFGGSYQTVNLPVEMASTYYTVFITDRRNATTRDGNENGQVLWPNCTTTTMYVFFNSNADAFWEVKGLYAQ